MEEKKSSYIGSVRFYKNLILLFVLLTIGLGIFFSIHYKSRYDALLHRTTGSNGVIDFSVEAEGPYYQSLYSDFYAPQDYDATARRSREAYLTFNILSYNNTEQILALLREKDIKATFFVTGPGDADVQQLLRDIVSDGHTLGMLSWSKDYATVYGSVDNYLADMHQLSIFIEEATGVKPTVFRFLGGSINSYDAGNYRELIAEMVRRGFVPYDWNVSVQDGQNTPTAEAQAKTVSEALERMDRAVILLQDTQEEEILMEALPGIVDTIREAGFAIKPLTPEIKPVLFAYGN